MPIDLGLSMPKKRTLGRAELEILQYIVDHHPISVGEVARHVAETSGQARTTVQTVMERLREKGYLSRKKKGAMNLYFPRMTKPDLMRHLVGDFVNGVLGGSLSPFMAYLNDQDSVNEQELEKLKQVVAELESRTNEREK